MSTKLVFPILFALLFVSCEVAQDTTKPGETYLGANVLVGTHNRDSNLNEPINSAKFELYLEKNEWLISGNHGKYRPG